MVTRKMVTIPYLTISVHADVVLGKESHQTGIKKIDLIRLAISEHVERYQASRGIVPQQQSASLSAEAS